VANNLISILQLGTLDYATALRLQQQLIALRKEEKISDVLLLLEHKPVITLGRNAKAANVLASPELLNQRGVELFECDRGGDVTFHGPGQIVGYPIFDLRSRAFDSPGRTRPAPSRKTMGIIEFVRKLEDVLMRTAADFGIPTQRVSGLTGVWTDPEILSARAQSRDLSFSERSKHHVGTAALGCPVERSSTVAPEVTTRFRDDQARKGQLRNQQSREGHDFSRAKTGPEKDAALPSGAEAKLAAIGIHVSRFVTSHGFALNVNTDLSYFNLIIPCGIASKPVTSMQKELGRKLDLNQVAESISRNLGAVFQTQILWVDTVDALLGRSVGVPMKPPTELRQLHEEDETTWA
jgi:lipoate-protein ligase B